MVFGVTVRDEGESMYLSQGPGNALVLGEGVDIGSWSGGVGDDAEVVSIAP